VAELAVTQKNEPEPDLVTIRRYGNRRLYDTRASSYVNLADVGALVREGRKIRVLDAKTDEDVTRRVLTQIVLETAAEDEKGLPLDLLYELARASDRAFRDFLDWYLRSSLEVYRDLQERWQADARRRWGEARPALEAWAQLWDPRQVAASLAQLLSPFDRRPATRTHPERGAGDEPAAEGPASGGEVAELRRRLDELERRVRAGEARSGEETARDGASAANGAAAAERPRRP
jgi:polyhydroxyalkanoate synthesis repressor PhaR